MPDPFRLNPRYDVIVIGGGVHGAAAALEATRLGYEVLLVEKHDFCSQTSANSLKIIHGGLRYLQSLNFRRSRESALEQNRLLKLAPHLVRPLPFLMATERSVTRCRPVMSMGLWFYDHLICYDLSDRSRGRMLTVEEAGDLCSHCVTENATGAVLWYDAQVRDSERLVLTYLKTAENSGAHLRNYVSVTHVETGDTVSVKLRDEFSGGSTEVTADFVIDSGSFLDPHPSWARAVNLVMKREVGEYAFGIKLRDQLVESNRLYFVTPLDDTAIVGTWYFPDRKDTPDQLTETELSQCLSDIRRLVPGLSVTIDDVTRVHLGRLPVSDASNPLSLLEKPIIRPAKGDQRVVCVTGVKYTGAGPTARKVLRSAGLTGTGKIRRPGPWYGTAGSSETLEDEIEAGFMTGKNMGADVEKTVRRLSRLYGSTGLNIVELASTLPGGFEPIPGYDAIRAEIDYCIEHEHCKTVADFLLRRSGIGALSPPSSEASEYCTGVMARHFDWSETRVDAEIGNLNAAFILSDNR